MTLYLLCDELVDRKRIYPKLSARFITEHVQDVPQLGSGADDSELWRYAVASNCNVFTGDTHFKPNGNADPNNGTHPGVIYYDDSLAVDKLIKGVEKINNAMTSQQIADIGLNQNQLVYLPDGWINP
jgi:hypothetical protein